MKTNIDSRLKNEDFFYYLKLKALNADDKIGYGEEAEYFAFISIPEKDTGTSELVAVVDKDFNLISAKIQISRYNVFFSAVASHVEYHSNISELLHGLRLLFTVRLKAQSR
jgi:hypothetical protein